MDQNFNPDQISARNGCFMGLDYAPAESELVLLQAPWDVTTSYRPGTKHGPQAIIEASYQLDMYSPKLADAWKRKIATLPIETGWRTANDRLRALAEKVIRALEKGAAQTDGSVRGWLDEINRESEVLHEGLYREAAAQLAAGRGVLTVGGDHSVSQGPIRAHVERYPNLSVLHIDAHADLRHEYEGFAKSHASIMNNVIRSTKLKKLVQIGIRDVSPTEIAFIAENKGRIRTFFDWDLKRAQYEGKPWKESCAAIVHELTDEVYVSFDIDGLDPRFCPDTGTPVPGGFDLEQISFLIDEVRESGKRIVGGDLVEVSPGDGDEWNGNVGARALWMMCLATLAGRSTA